jgi:protein TonB
MRSPLFRHRHLVWFLLISLFGHLLLLWFWLLFPPKESVLVEPAGSLQLRLQTGTKSTSDELPLAEKKLAAVIPAPATSTPINITSAQPSPRTQSTVKTGAKPEASQAAVAAPAEIQSAAPRAEQQSNTPAQSISQAVTDPRGEISVSKQAEDDPVTEEAQHLLGQLRQELARHFYYPAQAVRRGWQGTVQLGFEIDTGGRINNIYVAQSSGHTLLDRAAVAALGKLGQISFQGKYQHQLYLPVMYRLEEG